MPLDSQTPLARFLFGSDANASGRVKQTAFMPHWYTQNDRFELSTYDVAALPQKSVNEIAKEVEAARGRPCKGWALLHARDYWDEGLKTEPDNIPPRHVTVINWPSAKEDQKLIAQKLAAACTEAGGFEARPGLSAGP